MNNDYNVLFLAATVTLNMCSCGRRGGLKVSKLDSRLDSASRGPSQSLAEITVLHVQCTFLGCISLGKSQSDS